VILLPRQALIVEKNGYKPRSGFTKRSAESVGMVEYRQWIGNPQAEPMKGHRYESTHRF
jgi:hypothetical protein